MSEPFMGLPLRPGARPFDLPSWKQLRETLFSVQRAITFQYSTAADQSPGSLRVGFPFAQTPPTNFLSPYFGPRRPVPSAPSVPSTRLLIQQVVGYYDSLLLHELRKFMFVIISFLLRTASLGPAETIGSL